MPSKQCNRLKAILDKMLEKYKVLFDLSQADFLREIEKLKSENSPYWIDQPDAAVLLEKRSVINLPEKANGFTNYDGIELSPDGKSVAAIVYMDDDYYILIYDVESGKAVGQHKIDREEQYPESLYWSDDDIWVWLELGANIGKIYKYGIKEDTGGILRIKNKETTLDEISEKRNSRSYRRLGEDDRKGDFDGMLGDFRVLGKEIFLKDSETEEYTPIFKTSAKIDTIEVQGTKLIAGLKNGQIVYLEMDPILYED